MEEELLPPPPKKVVSQNGESDLLPPPPKKKLDAPISGSEEATLKDGERPSVLSQGSGTRVELPKITLGQETMQQGVAKSDMGMPSREEQLVKADVTTNQNTFKKIEKELPSKLEAQKNAQKELIRQQKAAEYLKRFIDTKGNVGQEGEPIIEEETAIDIYEPIKLEIDGLQPNTVSEQADPQLRQRVIMQNSKMAQSKTKDFQDIEPIIKDLKTNKQARQRLEEIGGNINNITNFLQTTDKEVKDNVKKAQDLNRGKMAEMGFVDSFENGFNQTTKALEISNALYSDDDSKALQLLKEGYIDNQLYGAQERNVVGEMLGGQAQPLGTTFFASLISGGNPIIGTMAGTATYARLGAGAEMQQAFNEAMAQGMGEQEAYNLAKQQSEAGFLGGAAEGILGTTSQALGLASKLKITPKFAKAITETLADAGIDGTAAMGAQYYQNLKAAEKGLDRKSTEGLGEQFASEAIFSIGFQALFGLGSKITPTNYKTLVNNIAKVPTVISQQTIDQAVKSGMINEAKAGQIMEDVQKSAKAQEKLQGVEIPEKAVDEVIDLQKQLDVLEEQKKTASPAALPAIEGKIEQLSSEMQIKAAIPLTAKEKAELNKLQTAKDSNTDYDKDRLKFLEDRQKSSLKAIKEADEVAQRLELAEMKKLQESKREIELSVDPIIKQDNLEENLGKTVSVNNKTGVLAKEGESRYVVEGDGFIVEINDESVVVDKTPKPKEKKTATLVDNKVDIDGTSYDLVSVNKDKNDKVVSLTLKKDNGQSITIRDEDLALDIAIAQKEQSLGIKPTETAPVQEETKVVDAKVAQTDTQVTKGSEVVEDTEYTDFIDKGKVTPERLNDIANKVKNREQLSPREIEIFSDKTGEINKIIATQEQPVAEAGQEGATEPTQEVVEQTTTVEPSEQEGSVGVGGGVERTAKAVSKRVAVEHAGHEGAKRVTGANENTLELDGYGTVSTSQFINTLVENGRLPKDALKNRHIQLTDEYATKLLNENSDLFPKENTATNKNETNLPTFESAKNEYDAVKEKYNKHLRKDGGLRANTPDNVKKEIEDAYTKMQSMVKQERDKRVSEDKRDTGLIDGIERIKDNTSAFTLVRMAMNRGVIPERQYNEFGKNLLHIISDAKDSHEVTMQTAEIIQDFSQRANVKVDDALARELQAAENLKYEPVEQSLKETPKTETKVETVVEPSKDVESTAKALFDMASGGQKPPKGETETEVKDGGVKKTVLTQRVYEGDTREEVKKAIEKFGLNRDVITMDEAEANAKKFIEEVGLDMAYQSIIDGGVVDGAVAEIYAAKIRDLNDQINSAKTAEEIEVLSSQLAEVYSKLSNRATGAGQFNKQLARIYDRDSDLGYKYEKKVQEYKDANNGEIPAEIAAKFKELDDQIKELSKQIKEAEAREQKAAEQQAVDEIKASIKRNPTANKKVRAKRLMSEGLDDIAQALGVQLMASGTKRASVVTGLTKIGQSLILNGEATIENVGEKVREFVKAKFGDKFNFDDFATDFDLAMIPEESDNKLKIPNSYIRGLVEDGIDNIDDLVKAIQKDYSGTEREIRDAITGYGKIVNQSKDEVSVQLRKMKDIGRLISAIEDVENKKRPLKSGFQRDKLSEEQRRLRKELREAMKNLPIDVDTQNNQLKTALDAAKSKVRNKIEELQKDIQTGERVEKNKRTVEADQELLELKQQRDELQEIHDNMFGGNELTYQEKIDIAIKSTEKSIAEYERRISENDLEPKKGEQLVPTKELKELQDKKSDLQKELNKLREAAKPQKTQAEIDEEKLNRAIEQKTKTRDELKDKLLKQDTSVKTRTPQSYDNDPKVKALNQEIEALNDAMQKLRDAKKIRKTQEQKALDIIERQIKDIDEKIKNGQLVASAKAKMSTPALEAARKRLEQKRLQLKNIKETADFLEQKRLENTKKSTQRRITELQEKLRVGDFDKKPKKLLIEDTELTKLRAEKIRLQDEYDKEIQKAELRNRTKVEVWKDKAWEAWGITRALSATGEWSFVGVQGLTQLISNPSNSYKAAKNAWSMMWSEKKSDEFLSNLRAQEFYPIMKQSKLAITEPNAKITAREELFNSQWTNIAWGVLGSPLKLKGESAYDAWLSANPFKALERASVGYLDTIRVLRFLDGVQMLEMQKKGNYNENQQAYKDMADVVNTLTGRASLGEWLESGSGSEKLSKIFFSPRNWASGVKTTILLPRQVYKWQKDSGTKELSVANKIALGDLSKMMGLTTSMVMLAAAGLGSDDDDKTSVGTDPTSSDFGKIIIGNKRIDPWGGKIQQIVFASRMYLDSITKNGETKNLGQDAFTPTKFDLLVQQATNKLSPSAKLLVNYMMAGRDRNNIRKLYGKEYSFKSELTGVLRPIYLNTVIELLQDDPTALDGMLLFYGFFGGGIGIQEDKKKKQGIVN